MLATKTQETIMLGAITGDIIGSVYEWKNIKTTEFEYSVRDAFLRMTAY